MILAPLRGVTIRCFRETFAEVIRDAGFTEAITPFIAAMPGYDPMKDRELCVTTAPSPSSVCVCGADGEGTAFGCLRSVVTKICLTPQFIGKDPEALRRCLERVKGAGYDTADLNCGCPYPMVRNKGRGSGLLRTPDVLRRMLEVGCETMGPGKFSVKARLGVDRPDELLKLMPLMNAFPLRFLTVHARTARQMYEGTCNWEMLNAVEKVAKVPIVINGDIPFPLQSNNRTIEQSSDSPMIGRAFVRYLGRRDDARELLERYIAASQAELCGDRPVLGRMKELLAYWKDLPAWKRRWPFLKLCRSVDELRAAI